MHSAVDCVLIRGLSSGKTTTLADARAQATAAGQSRLGIRWIFPTTLGTATFLAPGTLIGRAQPGSGRPRGDERTVTTLEVSGVSKEHAELVERGGAICLRDRGSKNGSYVNGRKVTLSPLTHGDVVRLGECVGVVCSIPHEDRGFAEFETGLFGGPALAEALDSARRVAEMGLSAVIVGETGTGKELFARAIHAWGRRARGSDAEPRSKSPFIAVNCASLPEQLADALLFGYVKGAFTGATGDVPGFFREADGGTLLLDEVLDLPRAVQAKLLRVLQEGEVLPVGETAPKKVSVRVLVTAHTPLQQAVAAGEFRQDLLMRLEQAVIALPPLRARKEDIAHLLSWLLARQARSRPTAEATHASEGASYVPQAQLIESLCIYDWPGNVREFVNVVVDLTARSIPDTTLEWRNLPLRIRDAERATASETEAAAAAAEGGEPSDLKRKLIAALRAHDGVVAQAARALGLKNPTMHRYLKRCRIEPADYRFRTSK